MLFGICIDNVFSKKCSVFEGLWEKCSSCGSVFYCFELEENFEVCFKCGYYMVICVCVCLVVLFDVDSIIEIGVCLGLMDLFKFKDQKKYSECIKVLQKNIGEYDVLIVMQGLMKGCLLVVLVFDFVFMGGLMGLVVGECFLLVVEKVLEIGVFYVCFFVSGGVCMQEGLFLLMQMVKILAVLGCLCDVGLLYILVLIYLIIGGVLVLFVMLGDINIVELQVLIGFVGLCVIEQIVCEKLFEGFQCLEFLLEYGVIDQICDCCEMCDCLFELLVMLGCQFVFVVDVVV